MIVIMHIIMVVIMWYIHTYMCGFANAHFNSVLMKLRLPDIACKCTSVSTKSTHPLPNATHYGERVVCEHTHAHKQRWMCDSVNTCSTLLKRCTTNQAVHIQEPYFWLCLALASSILSKAAPQDSSGGWPFHATLFSAQ